MSATPVEVADWTKEAKSFEPAMTATVGADVDTALGAVAAGLESQGFKTKDRSPSGFRASYRELVGGIIGLVTASDAGILDRTLISVSAAPGDGTAVLTITVEGGGQHRSGRKRGPAGLTAGLQDLQRRGVPVTTTPWQRTAS